MELFSERNCFINNNGANEYDVAFRNAVVTTFFNHYSGVAKAELYHDLNSVIDVFGIEQAPSLTEEKALKDRQEETLYYFQHCPWNKLFDFIELVLRVVSKDKDTLIEKYNLIFRMHGCKYRIVNDKTIPVVSEIEIEEIEESISCGLDAASDSITEAISLLSVKANPDYSAVIVKASNALETAVLYLADENDINEETLGKALKRLSRKGVHLDNDFIDLMKKVYKYASNAGIRHGGTNPVIATESDARLVLSICASCINYLKVNYL